MRDQHTITLQFGSPKAEPTCRETVQEAVELLQELLRLLPSYTAAVLRGDTAEEEQLGTRVLQIHTTADNLAHSLADQQPTASSPEHRAAAARKHARLCEEAVEKGLAHAYLHRHDDQMWIRAARVIRAVSGHLPGQAKLGLREGAALGKAVMIAIENNPPASCSQE